MDFTPIAPTDLKGKIDTRLLEKADVLLLESAKLIGSHTPAILQAVRDLLYRVNSYYSNKIESEGTHIVDIERAMQQEYSSNTKEKNLQLLSLAHISVQKEIEDYFLYDEDASPYAKDFIKNIHKSFYSKEGMEAFLKIAHDGLEDVLIPGVTRSREVKVGSYMAPEAKEVDGLMNQFEFLYEKSLNQSNSVRLIHILASHHRLMWVHPFLDGNGRTARLVLDGAFASMQMQGYGLWNISRGLARDASGYKNSLAHADMVRQGQYDGKGSLSSKALAEFVNFMLDISLDQVAYMNENLRLDVLTKRLDLYVLRVNDGLMGIDPLPKHSEKLFRHLLLVGECTRGSVAEVIGVKERTASRVISELLKRGYLSANSRVSPIRLKIGASMASYLFPSLVPEK
ncbi:MAG: cell filamentation protein Fic [Arcobacter sp.]|nr:MAG: cell filamentation protein Fic [Arcobacter sp.]